MNKTRIKHIEKEAKATLEILKGYSSEQMNNSNKSVEEFANAYLDLLYEYRKIDNEFKSFKKSLMNIQDEYLSKELKKYENLPILNSNSKKPKRDNKALVFLYEKFEAHKMKGEK